MLSSPLDGSWRNDRRGSRVLLKNDGLLPLKNDRVNVFGALSAQPILAFSGTNKEEPYLQLDLLQKKDTKCPDFTWRVIESANHIYYGKEQQTVALLLAGLKDFTNAAYKAAANRDKIRIIR